MKMGKRNKKTKQPIIVGKAAPTLSKPKATASSKHVNNDKIDVPSKGNSGFRCLSFVHPKSVKSAFGLDGNLRKPAGAPFSFRDYSGNDKKKKSSSLSLSSSPKKYDGDPSNLNKQQKRITQQAKIDASKEHGMFKARERSNYSVEDVVMDRIGCRPRSNSTDGELKLPQRGTFNKYRVLCYKTALTYFI